MSLDLYVHAKSSKRLTTAKVFDALAARHIGAAFFGDYINYKPVSGPLAYCTILGWAPKAFDLARLNEVLSHSDKKKQLDRLFAKEVLAYANVQVHRAAKYYDGFGEDYLDSLAGEIDGQFLDFMRGAKTVYEIQTSAGCSDFSRRFQMAVCCAIAESVDGLIEEPQSGEYFFPKDAAKHFRGFAD